LKKQLSKEFKHFQEIIADKKVIIRVCGSNLHENLFSNWVAYKKAIHPSRMLSFLDFFISIFDWILIFFTIFLVYKFSWIYLLGGFFLISMRGKLFNGIGAGFMIYDVKNNEDFLNLVWAEQRIQVESIENEEQIPGFKNPKFVFRYPHHWKEVYDLTQKRKSN
jgi:hypothetical protein